MGYFSNGSEGSGYQSQYCDHCANNDGEGGCAIWDAHLFFNGDQNADPKVGAVLALLIPIDARGYNQQCKLFRQTPELALETAGQESLFAAEAGGVVHHG